MLARKHEHPYGDIGQIVLFVVFLVIWVLDSFFLHVATFPADYVPLYVRLIILALCLVTAGYLFMSGHVVVQHEQHPGTVVSTGAFRYVRHPLYLASNLTYLGVTVSTLSLLSLALLLIIIAFHDYIASYEEQQLEAEFGEDYVSYKSRTGKWVPGIGKSPRAQGE